MYASTLTSFDTTKQAQILFRDIFVACYQSPCYIIDPLPSLSPIDQTFGLVLTSTVFVSKSSGAYSCINYNGNINSSFPLRIHHLTCVNERMSRKYRHVALTQS
jgi:hypothetical protein